MSDQNNTQDLSALESRLTALQTDMNAALSGATRRRTISMVVAIIAVVAVFIYMSIILNRLGILIKETSIDALADLAEQRLRAEVDTQSADLIREALAYAPQAADQLEERIMSAPGELTEQLRQMAKKELTNRIQEVEPQIIDALKQVLDDALAKAGKDQITDAEFQDILAKVATAIADSGHQAIDELRVLYHTGGESPPGADDIMAYFDLLAEGKDLTARQVHHRAVVLQTLAVMAKYQQESGSAKE